MIKAFTTADWDSLILKHVLPQLGSTLRDAFVVDPGQQDNKPLEAVLAWSPLLRSSMLSQLIEGGFFPKWLDALYIWLTSDHADFGQIATWCVSLPSQASGCDPRTCSDPFTWLFRYSYWKSYFEEDVVALSGVSRGFRKGLDLMNQAMALGDDAKYRYAPYPLSRVIFIFHIYLYLSRVLLRNQPEATRHPAEQLKQPVFLAQVVFKVKVLARGSSSSRGRLVPLRR